MINNKLPLIIFLILLVTACNNADNKHDGNKKEETKSQVDSLMDDVMEGHDEGMAKYSKLTAMRKEVQRVIDSLSKLPAKAKEASAPYKTKLDSAAKDLNIAISSMDKWMEEFNMDSAVDNIELRIQYLKNEKMKVGNVKETILNSLQKADSLLKSKF